MRARRWCVHRKRRLSARAKQYAYIQPVAIKRIVLMATYSAVVFIISTSSARGRCRTPSFDKSRTGIISVASVHLSARLCNIMRSSPIPPPIVVGTYLLSAGYTWMIIFIEHCVIYYIIIIIIYYTRIVLQQTRTNVNYNYATGQFFFPTLAIFRFRSSRKSVGVQVCSGKTRGQWGDARRWVGESQMVQRKPREKILLFY